MQDEISAEGERIHITWRSELVIACRPICEVRSEMASLCGFSLKARLVFCCPEIPNKQLDGLANEEVSGIQVTMIDS